MHRGRQTAKGFCELTISATYADTTAEGNRFFEKVLIGEK